MGWVKTEKTNKLSKLGDIDFTTTAPVDGNALVYDETNNVWIPGEGGGSSGVELTQAEYDLLTSAEKNNGSIYKITDKAKIYCLDEEYHAIKEITSVNYAQLTNTEKNNGTLYIITDEETTAADIPYSQGVSVADKLDSLSDTSVETISSLITLPTGSSLSANIQTYGRLVVINLVGFLAPAYTSIGELHFTNLPPLYGINELYAITPKGRFRIYNDGDVASIRLYDTNNATSYIGVPFVYLTV